MTFADNKKGNIITIKKLRKSKTIVSTNRPLELIHIDLRMGQ